MASGDNEEDETIRSSKRDPLKIALVFAVLSILLISSIITYSVLNETEQERDPEDAIAGFVEGVNEKNGSAILDVLYPPFKRELSQSEKAVVEEWKQDRIREYEDRCVTVSKYDVKEIIPKEEIKSSEERIYNRSEIEETNSDLEDFFGVDIDDYCLAEVDITAEWNKWGERTDIETCLLYEADGKWYLRGSLLPVPEVGEVRTELEHYEVIICDDIDSDGTARPRYTPELTVEVLDDRGEPISNLDVELKGPGLNKTITTNGSGGASLELDSVYLTAGVDQERIELRITIDHLTGSTTTTKVVGVVERVESLQGLY